MRSLLLLCFPRLDWSRTACRALLTLGGFVGLFLLVRAVSLAHASPLDLNPAFGVLRLLTALPLVLGTVWLTSAPDARRFVPGLQPALVLTSTASAEWVLFEAASSFYGELPANDAIEVTFNVMMVLGLATAALLGIRAHFRRHARDRVKDELRASLEGGLLALGLALEARDLETAGHTERVVQLAEQLGHALGLSVAERAELRQGAYLHDIGKLSIPDAVLLKRGQLDPGEWATMQTHAARGADLAGQVPTLAPGARQVIRHHHERWDGAGYPDRLAGDRIPLLARVFAVVDVYDALTSDRPYKPAWTREDALRELAAQSGRHFDPQVTRVFLNLHGWTPEPRSDDAPGAPLQRGPANA